MFFVYAHWLDSESLILIIRHVVSSSSVISEHFQHVLFVFFIAFECSQLLSKLCTGGIRFHMHNAGQCSGNCTPFLTVVWCALNHKCCPEIGITKPKCSEL